MVEPIAVHVVEDLQTVLKAFLEVFTEVHQTGGSYVPAENRWMLLGLALSLHAKDILETGYNTGLTTLALALSGAQVTGVDNCYEQPEVDVLARSRLVNFPNVRLVQEDALLFLVQEPEDRYDLIFIDDCHWPSYTRHECREIQRVLRPGGVAVFHDTFYAELWDVLESSFPSTWQRLNLPSWQHGTTYSGIATMAGRDLGLGMVRKPWAVEPAVRSLQECMAAPHASDGRARPSLDVVFSGSEGQEIRCIGEENDTIVTLYCNMLRTPLLTIPMSPAMRENMQDMLRSWGKYCSSCASFVGQERYQHKAPKENG